MINIFYSVDPEKEKIYREVEKHYITEDIVKQIFENILEEHVTDDYEPEDIHDEIWEMCQLDAIYEYWTYNCDANLSHWDNINTAIDSVLSEEKKESIVDTLTKSMSPK